MYNCPICMSPGPDNYIHPQYCNCKMKFHEICLLKCYEKGLLCPICRIKDTILDPPEEPVTLTTTIHVPEVILIPAKCNRFIYIVLNITNHLLVLSYLYCVFNMAYNFIIFKSILIMFIIETIKNFNCRYIKNYKKKYRIFLNNSNYRQINNGRL